MYGIEGLLAGRTLVDRYRIEEVIGRGGMGAVYRARDLRLGREVAVKVITVAAPDPAAHERLRARFHREARAAAALHHPNVVAVYDFGTDPQLGLDFLVMELLKGEDLASRLQRKGPPALATALTIVEQAARGLAAGHRAGLIHRDVKPGNLFLEPGDRIGDVRVKVLDFGIADLAADAASDEQTMTQLTVLGRSPFSPAFASPEQQRGDGRLTPATDVFSLGAVAFQLLTGKRAFTSPDLTEMLEELAQSLATELPRVRGIPRGVAALLERALEPRPEDRFPTAQAFADALAVLRADHDTSREPRSGGGRPTDAGAPAREVTEQTRLWTHAPESAPPPAAPAYADSATRLATEVQGILARGTPGAPLAGPSAPSTPAPAPRRGWLSRVASAVWSFLLTATSFALFATTWIAVVTGLQEDRLEQVYAAAAASVLLTPLAVHRMTGCRGRFRLTAFASLLGSLGCVYVFADSQSMGVVLGALFTIQIAASLAAEHLLARRTPTAPPLSDPHHTPGGA